MRKSAVCLLLGLMLSACVSVHYAPYTGDQSQWKPAPGSEVDYSDGVIPVYTGMPAHHFTVIGIVTASNTETSIKTLIWFASIKAKHMGAEALIVANKLQENHGAVGNWNGYMRPDGPNMVVATPGVIFHNTVSLWAIKWK